MARDSTPVLVVGQGLCGTAVAWHLHRLGIDFRVVDRARQDGASRVAAGLVTPITGKGLNPGWCQEIFLPEAIAFYQQIEREIGESFWHPMTVLRLFRSEKERSKWEKKRHLASHRAWVAESEPGIPGGIKAVFGGFAMRGGGWLDTATYLDGSRKRFEQMGCLIEAEADSLDAGRYSKIFRCEGAAGLIGGRRAHRCAKGEILTVRAPDLELDRILNRAGWIVPLGGALFRVGATYEWDRLDCAPSEAGREAVLRIFASFTDAAVEVVDHRAGVRPIIHNSVPVVEKTTEGWWINGLGSKGTQNAPGVARRVVENCFVGGRNEWWDGPDHPD